VKIKTVTIYTDIFAPTGQVKLSGKTKFSGGKVDAGKRWPGKENNNVLQTKKK